MKRAFLLNFRSRNAKLDRKAASIRHLIVFNSQMLVKSKRKVYSGY